MDYQNFDLADFIMDEYFQDWVVHPTAESDAFWQDWLANHPEKKKMVAQARAIIGNLDFKAMDISAFSKDRVLDNINAVIRTEELARELEVPREQEEVDDDGVHETVIYALETKEEKIKSWYRVAVVIFVIAAAGLSGFWYSHISPPPPLQAEVPEFIERTCGPGEKLNIKLADGTQVKLNSNSKLIIPAAFSQAQRKVVLIGEAFFEVTKDIDRPFVVASDPLITMVHGTSFNVRAFPHEQEIKVAVAGGRVSVQSTQAQENQGRQAILLSPAEMAVFKKETHRTAKMAFDFIKEIGWKDGIIHFENADIHQVLQTLESWYGVTFIKNGKINEDRDYTGSFNNKSLEVVLTGLGLVFDFTFEIKGKIIILT